MLLKVYGKLSMLIVALTAINANAQSDNTIYAVDSTETTTAYAITPSRVLSDKELSDLRLLLKRQKLVVPTKSKVVSKSELIYKKGDANDLLNIIKNITGADTVVKPVSIDKMILSTQEGFQN